MSRSGASQALTDPAPGSLGVDPENFLMGFWQHPPRWVWLFLLASFALFGASMVTVREGLRFVSRPLQDSEREIVLLALARWTRVEPDTLALAILRAMLRQKQLRAMDEPTFARTDERGTLGYTDENGRILLNPRICFATFHCVGRVHPSDVVRTCGTVIHEYRHLQHSDNESEACREELRLIRKAWLMERDSCYAQEWLLWERAVRERVRPYLDDGEADSRRPQLHCPGKVLLVP